MWYRSSPAELYYKAVVSGAGVEQTPKLEKLCESFKIKLIDRGKNARPEVDELPPLKPPKAKMCKHRCKCGTLLLFTNFFLIALVWIFVTYLLFTLITEFVCTVDDKSSSSSSDSEDDLLDEGGLQGYTDRIMLELQRKQSHPRRLHPEMWYVFKL